MIRRIVNRPRWLVLSYLAVYVVLSELYAVIEHKGPIEGLWWGLVSGSTVGYGDYVPAHTAARAVGAVLIIVSITFVAMGTAQLANHLLTDPNAWTHDEQEEMKRALILLTGQVGRLTEQLDEVLGIQQNDGKDEGDDT